MGKIIWKDSFEEDKIIQKKLRNISKHLILEIFPIEVDDKNTLEFKPMKSQ